jgi:hypothetical protein
MPLKPPASPLASLLELREPRDSALEALAERRRRGAASRARSVSKTEALMLLLVEGEEESEST